MNRANIQFRHSFYDVQYKIKDEYKHLTNNVEFIKANYKDE